MQMQQTPRPAQQQSATQRLAFRVTQRIWWIVSKSEYYVLEVAAGLFAAGWGLWLLNPAWHSFVSTPTFDAMARYAPEEVWGAVLLLLGAGQVAAAGVQHLIPRQVLAFGAVFLWLFVSSMFMMANIASTASVIYPGLALLNILIFFRLSGEIGRGRRA